MLTVTIFYTGENGSAKQFVEEMFASGLVEKVRAEPGNLRYEYFLSFEDPETVLLLDQWENEEALELHHKSPMMREIAALRERCHLRMRPQKFTEKEA